MRPSNPGGAGVDRRITGDRQRRLVGHEHVERHAGQRTSRHDEEVLTNNVLFDWAEQSFVELVRDGEIEGGRFVRC